ncbi:MAG: DUF885 family protein, partial [Lachnospiraceae bacterium]|nr:DUF885 family protein [Lachnospiraceae bacterium]
MGNQDLCMKYRELDRDIAELHYRLHSENIHENEIFIPTKENLFAASEALMGLRIRLSNLPAPDPVFAAVKHQFGDFLDTVGFAIEGASPLAVFHAVGQHFESLARHTKKNAKEKLEVIKKRFACVLDNREEILQLVLEHAGEKGLGPARNIIDFNRDILQYYYTNKLRECFRDLNVAQYSELTMQLRKMISALKEMEDKIPVDAETARKEADDLDLTMKMEPDAFRSLLHDKLGIDMDDMLTWYEDGVRTTRDEVFAIAAGLPIAEPAPSTMEEVNDILFKYSAPKKTPEEMFEAGREYMKRSRDYARKIIRMPEDEECLVVPTVYACKDSFPWGGYEGGDFSSAPYTGHMFLNEYNYNNITDAWIKMDSMHEAYPGHHCQMVRAAWDPLPEVMKIGGKNVPLLEGTCVRTERAFQDKFDEDPFYKLHVAYRRHHVATRIWVDLTLNYFGGTIGEACEIYKKELGLDFTSARGQVLAHQTMRGYFNCYYYGLRKLEQWEKEYGFDKKEYTELLFSAGFVSMETF